MCGSSPLPEVVTRSIGTGPVARGSAARSAATRSLIASVSAGFIGPRFDAPDAAPLYAGLVPDARLQKYLGSSNGWPINAEPTGFAPRGMGVFPSPPRGG